MTALGRNCACLYQGLSFGGLAHAVCFFRKCVEKTRGCVARKGCQPLVDTCCCVTCKKAFNPWCFSTVVRSCKDRTQPRVLPVDTRRRKKQISLGFRKTRWRVPSWGGVSCWDTKGQPSILKNSYQRYTAREWPRRVRSPAKHFARPARFSRPLDRFKTVVKSVSSLVLVRHANSFEVEGGVTKLAIDFTASTASVWNRNRPPACATPIICCCYCPGLA